MASSELHALPLPHLADSAKYGAFASVYVRLVELASCNASIVRASFRQSSQNLGSLHPIRRVFATNRDG